MATKLKNKRLKLENIFFFPEIIFNPRKTGERDVSTNALWWSNAATGKFRFGNNIPFKKRITNKFQNLKQHFKVMYKLNDKIAKYYKQLLFNFHNFHFGFEFLLYMLVEICHKVKSNKNDTKL